MTEFIDAHAHLAALDDGANGCFVSRKLLRSPLLKFLAWKHRFDFSKPRETNAKYIADLLAELRASRRVSKAVLLAMDGVYDAAGRRDDRDTHFVVGNDYVLSTARAHPELLAGVSINPQRRDAVDELHRCADAGAVLVKVLPNSQRFDPGDKRHVPFYRALAERKLPLLSHVGFEMALIGVDQSVGEPTRLRVPLDEGVTVIAAHACSFGLVFNQRYVPDMSALVERYPRFFTDVSATTLPHRMSILWRLRREPQIQERLIFGTDYPLSVFHCACWGRVGLATLRQLVRTKNRFDRQVLVCEHLGLRVRSVGELLPPRPAARQ